MLNTSKFDKVLSILFGALRNNAYFCTSIFDKYNNRFNKQKK